MRTCRLARRAEDAKELEIDAVEESDIASARDLTELRRLLVSGGGQAEAPQLAVDAFRRFHGAGRPKAFDTALLLCTDWRWRRSSARVLAGVLDTGLLDEAEQDRLAHGFLWRGQVPYVHPLTLLGHTFVEIDLDPSSGRRQRRPRKVKVDPRTQMTTNRSVRPPLRSWAATRLLLRRQVEASELLERAHALSARDGAAVVTGGVHAADELDADESRKLLEAALRWPDKAPRLAALKHLATHDEQGRAEALAADDRDASIRAWGRKPTKRTDPPSLFD